jgi:P-type Ca2+ transporter type 2C
MDRSAASVHSEESLTDALARLAVDPAVGLDDAEMARRLVSSGPNELPRPARRLLVLRFFDQLREPMNLLLLVAALVSGAALREVLDAVAITVIVMVNAVIALVQEGRADRALAALEELSAPEATVRRGGSVRREPASRLVPGDVVLLAAGDRVPADLRLLAAADLEADESLLTGESVPVPKVAGSGDRAGWQPEDRLWWGSFVTRGTGTGVVLATGPSSRLGEIAASLHEPSPPTPLQDELGRLSTRLGVAAVVIAAAVFAVTLVRVGWSLEGVEQALLSAVALAVAAVPEGLPTVTLVALAAGVRRMASHRAIVRRLPAVETLGSASVIVTDKTGTITENRMTVTDVWVTGVPQRDPAQLQGLPGRRARRIAALANDASLDPDVGDPMELALLRFAATGDEAIRLVSSTRRASYPADSQRRRMTAVCTDGEGLLIVSKGAPETLLERCTRFVDPTGAERPLTAEARAEILIGAAGMAADGMRVLALADRSAVAVSDDDAEEVERDLTFVALVALEDPVRPGAAAAVAESAAAGIRVMMATGDHPATARAIARDIGLATGDPPVTGDQLRGEIPSVLLDRPVFARVEPQQKLALVRALQGRGEVVAMTGDGVNDAPALRRADIGVALGGRGSDVAREAADMIVTDDDLATIVTATREGRGIYDNIRKVVDYLVAGNLSEIGVVVGALLLLPWLGVPLLPLQLLWVNLLTDGLPAVALGNDRHGTDLMHQTPRPRREHLLDRTRLTHLIVRGGLMATACLAAGLAAASLRDDAEVVRTVLLTTLVLGHLLYAFVARQPAHATLRDRLAPAGWLGTPWLVAAVTGGLLLHLVILVWEPAQQVFGTVTPDRTEWLLIVAGALVGMLLTILHRRLTGGTESRTWTTAETSPGGTDPRSSATSRGFR